MSHPAAAAMTSDELVALAMQQPEGERHKLFAGKVGGMAPSTERALAKYRIGRRLPDAVERVGFLHRLPARKGIEIDATTTHKLNAPVGRCPSRYRQADRPGHRRRGRVTVDRNR